MTQSPQNTGFVMKASSPRLIGVALLVCAFVLPVVLVYLRSYPSQRQDGWYCLLNSELPDRSQLAVIANGDPETWNRSVSWEWLRDGIRADSGFMGVVETKIPLRHLSPKLLPLSDQTFFVYDSHTSLLWGVFRIEVNRPRLLERSEVESENLLPQIAKLLNRDEVEWIPR